MINFIYRNNNYKKSDWVLTEANMIDLRTREDVDKIALQYDCEQVFNIQMIRDFVKYVSDNLLDNDTIDFIEGEYTKIKYNDFGKHETRIHGISEMPAHFKAALVILLELLNPSNVGKLLVTDTMLSRRMYWDFINRNYKPTEIVYIVTISQDFDYPYRDLLMNNHKIDFAPIMFNNELYDLSIPNRIEESLRSIPVPISYLGIDHHVKECGYEICENGNGSLLCEYLEEILNRYQERTTNEFRTITYEQFLHEIFLGEEYTDFINDKYEKSILSINALYEFKVNIQNNIESLYEINGDYNFKWKCNFSKQYITDRYSKWYFNYETICEWQVTSEVVEQLVYLAINDYVEDIYNKDSVIPYRKHCVQILEIERGSGVNILDIEPSMCYCFKFDSANKEIFITHGIQAIESFIKNE